MAKVKITETKTVKPKVAKLKANKSKTPEMLRSRTLRASSPRPLGGGKKGY